MGYLLRCCLWFVLVAGMVQVYGQQRCGTDEIQAEYLSEHPQARADFEEARRLAYHLAGQQIARKNRAVVTIPVVVHVIHNGEAIGDGPNITKEQILSQIDVLNEDFRKLNVNLVNTPAAFQPLAADLEIEFCLALRDANGNATEGIERINGGRMNWTPQQIDTELKPLYNWPPDEYLNIYTVRLNSSISILGYAFQPGFPDSVDGVVVGFRYFGREGNLQAPYNKGRTATHEIGHWLGLDHLWGTNDPNVSSCNDDDQVADTPNQEFGNYGCPSFPNISCNNAPNGDMFMNYMDYVNDDCMSLFTQGQKDVVWNVLNNDRLNILSSDACTRFADDAELVAILHPRDEVCTGEFRPLVEFNNQGSAALTSLNVNYTIDNTGFNQFPWTGNVPSGGKGYILLPELDFTPGNYSIQIFLTDPNGQPDGNPLNDELEAVFTVLSNDTSDGIAIPVSQGFQDGFIPPDNWMNDNPGGIAQWQIFNGGGAFGTSTLSAFIDNFSGTQATNPQGERDALISEAIMTSETTYPWLFFDVAYARRDDNSRDALSVYYSLDCGDTWSRVWEKGGAVLATAPDVDTNFIPQDTEWRSENVPMPYLFGQNRILIKFENLSDWGNNIYLDNIMLTPTTVGLEATSFLPLEIAIYPNPTAGKVHVTSNWGSIQDAQIVVYDVLGREQFGRVFTRNSGIDEVLDLDDLTSGMYLLQLTTGAMQQTRQLIIR